MRNGQNKRMRGRNRKSHNPLARVFESNGPDVKIRGTPSHIAEKYIQLARDAQSSGDPVSAENYYQHAEHYYRLIAAAQEQFRQSNPQFYRPEMEARSDDAFDDDDDGQSPMGDAPFGTREPQPYVPRDAQPYPPRDQQQNYPPRDQQQNYAPRPQQHQQPQPSAAPVDSGVDVDRLPSFITGGSQSGQQPYQGGHNQGGHNQGGHQGQQFGPNGHEGQPDRFPLHRRRRRHRGPRPHDGPGAPPAGGGAEMADDAPHGE
jgi:uncharacterized protein DUF4167